MSVPPISSSNSGGGGEALSFTKEMVKWNGNHLRSPISIYKLKLYLGWSTSVILYVDEQNSSCFFPAMSIKHFEIRENTNHLQQMVNYVLLYRKSECSQCWITTTKRLLDIFVWPKCCFPMLEQWWDVESCHQLESAIRVNSRPFIDPQNPCMVYSHTYLP